MLKVKKLSLYLLLFLTLATPANILPSTANDGDVNEVLETTPVDSDEATADDSDGIVVLPAEEPNAQIDQ